MHNLSNVQTADLMCELARRTIANADKDASPRKLLELACLIASVLGTRQSFLFSEELRDAADEMENCRVRV